MKSLSLPAKRVKRSFTLIELLVVIAIIAILAGILMPALSQARERGKSATCINNLKSISLALGTYAGDYRGVIPYMMKNSAGNTQSWIATLYIAKLLPSIKVVSSNGTDSGDFSKVSFCPSSPYHPPYQSYDKTTLRTYGMLYYSDDADYSADTNSKKDAMGDCYFVLKNGENTVIEYFKLNNVKTPGAVPYVGDSGYNSTASAIEQNRPAWQVRASKTFGGAPHLKLQHNERCNAIFFDGHVSANDRYQLRMSPAWVKYANDANGTTIYTN